MVYLPAGVYKITSPLRLPQSTDYGAGSVVIRGAGMTRSKIYNVGRGHAIIASGANGYRTDQIVLEDRRIEAASLDSGDGIHFDHASPTEVETKITLHRVAIWSHGGWGFSSFNTQSSVFMNCHFRGNRRGHISLRDDTLTDWNKEPNANVIRDGLLDNMPSDSANVAAIHLFNANSTLIEGNTIQGNGIGKPAAAPALLLDHCTGVTLINNWIEDLPSSAAGLLATDSRALTIVGHHGSGAHARDIELRRRRAVTIVSPALMNDVPNVMADADTLGVTISGGVLRHPQFIVDHTRDHIRVMPDVTFHEFGSFKSSAASGNEHVSNWFGANLLRNPNFIDDLSGWKYHARATTRDDSPANRHGRFPYVRVNGQVLPDNTTQVFLLEQEVAVDATERGYYSVTFDYMVESVGAGFTDITLVAVPATSNDQQFNLRVQAGAPTGVWRRETLRVLLPEHATSVKFGVNSQQGARAAIVRLANIRLHPGLQTEAGGYMHLNEELGGTLRESARIENLKSGAGPSSARPVCQSGNIGMQFYDTTLASPIWCDGHVWRLATGAIGP